jgi:hypothetical protein
MKQPPEPLLNRLKMASRSIRLNTGTCLQIFKEARLLATSQTGIEVSDARKERPTGEPFQLGTLLNDRKSKEYWASHHLGGFRIEAFDL